jgi:protein-arginine kinase activator protein McsA
MKINTVTKTLLIGGVLLTLACLVLQENEHKQKDKSSSNESEEKPLNQLENELKVAVENEDFEMAAKLRDIINSKKPQNV